MALSSLMLLWMVVGCQPARPDLEQTAREELSKVYSCPMDRVTASARADLRPFDLLVGPSAPPADVAADPGRLAVWTERQRKLQENYDRDAVIEATGCDQHVYYVCGSAEGSNLSVVSVCRAAVHPPAL